MHIKLAKECKSGSITLPAAEYWVSFNQSSSEFTLSAGGKDLKIKAIKRKNEVKGKSPTLSFYKGGGKTWSLIASLPRLGEWVAFVDEN